MPLVKILKKTKTASVIELSELLVPYGHKYSTYLLLAILKILPHNPRQCLFNYSLVCYLRLVILSYRGRRDKNRERKRHKLSVRQRNKCRKEAAE